MRLSSFLFRLSSVLLPLSISATTYLYLYPLFHRCSFPSPPSSSHNILQNCRFADENLQTHYADSRIAPFRLLALGDPQLEGDTSLPDAVEYGFPGFGDVYNDLWERNITKAVKKLRIGVQDVVTDVKRLVKYARKRIDLIGNDYYLAHVYRTLHWWTKPTHVTILGDLLGSQWVGDEEFEDRSLRFWNRVFRGAELPKAGKLQTYKGSGEDGDEIRASVEILGFSPSWRNRIINLAGNHDIGYAGDISELRIKRFEAQFGPVNGDIHFTLPSAALCTANSSKQDNTVTSEEPPTLRLIVLNSMNLDTPALDHNIQLETFAFINSVIGTSAPVTSHNTATILLTHIPLHKESGICADSPFFSYFSDDAGGVMEGGLKEQNMISDDTSRSAVLQGIFGMSPDAGAAMRGLGRDGLMLTGHDHVGCDVYHYADRESGEWRAKAWDNAEAQQAARNEDVPGLREVTVRSMMGEFGGNAGLVSAWWDAEKERWMFEVQNCMLGVQHIWWAVHVSDLVTFLVIFTALLVGLYEWTRDVDRINEKPQSDRKATDWVAHRANRNIKSGQNGSVGNKRKLAGKLK